MVNDTQSSNSSSKRKKQMALTETYQTAMDAEVTFSDGTDCRLSDLWEKSPLLLVFLRHFGWPFCREQAVQLHRSKAQFEDMGIQVVLVGLGTPYRAKAFRKQFFLSFPIICDPEKKLYQTYGLGRSSVTRLASPAFLLKGLKALSRGYTPSVPRGDVMQLPGVFLIDTAGKIRYAHYSKDPSDNPTIETLLALKDIFREK